MREFAIGVLVQAWERIPPDDLAAIDAWLMRWRSLMDTMPAAAAARGLPADVLEAVRALYADSTSDEMVADGEGEEAEDQ